MDKVLEDKGWLCLSVAVCVLAVTSRSEAEDRVQSVETHRAAELVFASEKTYGDPFNDVEAEVVVTGAGAEWVVPAFWSGGLIWRARFASEKPGVYRYRSRCSDAANAGLHGVEGNMEVAPYTGDNPLYRHGPLRVAPDRRHFEHADGTPFLWLGDTWWMGLTKRLVWPEEFQSLTEDRRRKGFNVIQIVAGLYPDMPPFDERGANEAGFPWEVDYRGIRPAYFDAADKRLQHLIDRGLTPCIVGAWGYHLPWLGVERMKKHWRHLVARYAAWPVVWCIAGESTMPYYLSTKKDEDSAFQKRGWTEVAAYVRRIDPFHRLVTIHPTDTARRMVEDVSVLDFDMLQTGHGDRASIPNTIRLVRASRTASPTLPTVVGEVCYEGILDTCFDDIQRFMVWSSYLSGTAGHTYGANGIWQLNRREAPFGKSPHGGNWGNTPWDEAMKLPGSTQVGLAKRLLEKYPWQRFEVPNAGISFEIPPEPSRWGDWIWFPEGNPALDAPAEKRYFRRAFTLPAGQIESALLRLAVDDLCTVYLNGVKLGSHRGWKPARQFTQVKKHLRPGKNVLAVLAENASAPVKENPAGLLAALEATGAGGTRTEVLSDAEWRVSRKEDLGWKAIDFDDGAWAKAIATAPNGGGPWGEVSSAQDEFHLPYDAGILGEVRILYISEPVVFTVRRLDEGTTYRARYVNPQSGEETDLGEVGPSISDWRPPPPPGDDRDWVLILEAKAK